VCSFFDVFHVCFDLLEGFVFVVFFLGALVLFLEDVEPVVYCA